MVMQVAYIRSTVLFIQLVIASNDIFMFPTFQSVLNTINTVSTLFAMYGLTILVSISQDSLASFRIKTIFSLLNGILFFCNVQGPIFDILAQYNIIPCNAILPAVTRANTWQHLALILEVFCLSLLGTWFLRPKKNAIFDRYQSQALLKADLGEASESMIRFLKYGTSDSSLTS